VVKKVEEQTRKQGVEKSDKEGGKQATKRRKEREI
jgi:hypothetical protein